MIEGLGWLKKGMAIMVKNNIGEWKQAVEAGLRETGIMYRPLSKDEFGQLPEFNWDVKKFQNKFVLALKGQSVEILHVIEVVEKGGFFSREKGPPHFRAKCLVTCPENVFSGREDPDDPFSVSSKEEDGHRWHSDVDTQLEEAIADHLNKHVSLKSNLTFSGHTKINAWLEAFTGQNYLSINTAKRYQRAQEVADYVTLCNGIIEAIRSFSA